MWISVLFIFVSDNLFFFQKFNRIYTSTKFFIITKNLGKCGSFSKFRIKLFSGEVLIKIIHHKVTSRQLQDLFNLVAIWTIIFSIDYKIHNRINKIYYNLYKKKEGISPPFIYHQLTSPTTGKILSSRSHKELQDLCIIGRFLRFVKGVGSQNPRFFCRTNFKS